MGADEEGNKELLAVSDGYRESKVTSKDYAGYEGPGAGRRAEAGDR